MCLYEATAQVYNGQHSAALGTRRQWDEENIIYAGVDGDRMRGAGLGVFS
jgi:hypothetical protein